MLIILLPAIFHFLVGILIAFLTWHTPLRLRYKANQSA